MTDRPRGAVLPGGGDHNLVVEQGVGAMWTIDGQAGTIEATDTWGTPQRDALAIVQALCEQKPIRVYDHEGALHQAHTAAAIAKATANRGGSC